MTESEMLSALQELSNTLPDRDGLVTTSELAVVYSERGHMTIDAATRSIRIMWSRAKRDGRLVTGRVLVENVAGERQMVQAYKLKGVT